MENENFLLLILIPREYIAVSNIWIVINNPNDSKLCDLIDDITFESFELCITYKCMYFCGDHEEPELER